jgi:hypothetical protein
MLIDAPISFDAAIKLRKVKSLLPTELGSAELAEIPVELRERAMFSARNHYAEILQALDDRAGLMLEPKTVLRDGHPVTTGIDLATARLDIKQLLGEIGYVPDEEDQGTLKDLSSDRRINLVYKMNVEMAQGYGAWEQGQDPDALDAFPAQELFRAEGREKPRDWFDIWTAAGGQIFDGRMIALKNDPIWEEISDFGTPYPPFKFNSGMWVRDVSRKQAIAMGLIDRDTQVEPQHRLFNVDLQGSSDIRSAALRQALEAEGYRFDANGVMLANERVYVRDSLGRFASDGGPLSEADNIERGSKALRRALAHRRDVQNAMNRSGLGRIDFVWGTPGETAKDYAGGFGIAHVLAKHPEAIDKIPVILAKGAIKFHPGEPDKRIVEYGQHMVAMAKEKKTSAWLITAYKNTTNGRRK